MVVGGLAGIAAGIGAVAWLSMRLTLRGRFVLGLAALGPATLAAFALALLADGPAAALTVPTGALLLGFGLAFAAGGGGGGGSPEPDDEPPWWPGFELDLRRYERTRAPSGRR